MTPEEMQAWLDKAATLARKGYPPARISAWLKSRTNGQFSSGQELSQAIIAARQAAPSPAEQWRDASRATSAAAMQGITAGFSDELAGGLAALVPGGKGYREARDAERELAARGGMAPQIIGGVASGLLTLPFGGAGAGGYLAGIGKGALIGAGYGAAAGAGAAPEMSDIPEEAAQGAAFGAASGGLLGALIPPALTVGRTGLTWLNTLRGKPSTLKRIADQQIGAAVLGASPDAATALQPLDRAVELQLPMPIAADASSRATRLARRSINAAPDLTDMAHEVTAARVGQRAGRLAEGLARETGLPEDVAAAAVRGSKKATQQAGKILYEGLNPTVLDDASGIPQLLDQLAASHPEVATQIARMANRQPGEPLTFEVVNSIRQHLSEVGWNFRSVGKQRAMGDALVAASDAIEAALSNPQGPTPAYAGVRAQYKALMDVQRAYAQGAKSATQAMTDADLEAFQAMSDEAKAAWRAGKQYATTRRLRGADPLRPSEALRPVAPATPLGETNGVGSPGREGWKAMFPSQQAVTNVDDMARLARRQAGTEQRLTGGSLTDQGLADVGTDFAQSVAKTGASGPESFAAGMARRAFDALMMPQNQAIGDRVGRGLMAPYTPAARAELIRQMELAAALRGRRGLLNAQTIGALLGGGAQLRPVE